jgi:hypothetical protein
MPMRLCERCRGFVPESVDDCPHCASAGRLRMLGKIAALTIGAGFAIAISIPGCAYGCPAGRCGPPPVDATSVDAAPDGPPAAPPATPP